MTLWAEPDFWEALTGKIIIGPITYTVSRQKRREHFVICLNNYSMQKNINWSSVGPLTGKLTETTVIYLHHFETASRGTKMSEKTA